MLSITPRRAANLLTLQVVTLVLLALQLAATAQVMSSGGLHRLLVRSLLAQHTVNLVGRQSEILPTPGSTALYIERAVVRTRDGSSRTVCISPPEQKGSVVQDDGTWLRIYRPDQHTVSLSRTMPQIRTTVEADAVANRILHNYQVKVEQDAVLAGRRCRVLVMDPYDQHGHEIKVWVDAATGVTLSRIETDSVGRTVGFTTFINVQYPSQLASSSTEWHTPRTASTTRFSLTPVYRNIGPLRKQAGFPVTAPLCMPRGFVFDSCELARIDGHRTACLRYSDGLAIVTVFESWMPHAPAAAVECHPLGRGESIATATSGQVTAVVIGPQDMAGIMRIERALDGERERAEIVNLARAFGVTRTQLVRLRDQGLGMDAIAAVLEISMQTRRGLESVVQLYHNLWDWKSVAQRLRANFTSVERRMQSYM